MPVNVWTIAQVMKNQNLPPNARRMEAFSNVVLGKYKKIALDK